MASAAVKAPATAPKLFEECAEALDRHIVADVYRLSRDTLSAREMRRRKPVKRVCLASARYCAAQLAWKKPGAAE